MHAQTLEAAAWWARPRGVTNDAWITNYKQSLRTRHRDVIARVIQEIGPSSVLEVGCHCGPNLIRLAEEQPDIAHLAGFDVNAEAVAAGQRWAESKGLSARIQIVSGRIPSATETLADGCVDVVLSCYALAYTAPQDLDAVLWELGRLAKRAIVLAEPMTEAPIAQWHHMLNGYTEWAHNYHAASKWIGSWRGMTLRTEAVTPPVDRLERVLVAVRDEARNALSPASTP